MTETMHSVMLVEIAVLTAIAVGLARSLWITRSKLRDAEASRERLIGEKRRLQRLLAEKLVKKPDGDGEEHY